jgi:hypothetical protein
VRALLKTGSGPPVADAFLDLGAIQTPVRIVAAALARKRVDGGIGKLERTSILSLPLVRCPGSSSPVASPVLCLVARSRPRRLPFCTRFSLRHCTLCGARVPVARRSWSLGSLSLGVAIPPRLALLNRSSS